jgi:hypothetical protein
MMMMMNPALITPVLVQEPKEPVLKWQWQRDGYYLSGFATKEAAERYGRRHRWIEGNA